MSDNSTPETTPDDSTPETKPDDSTPEMTADSTPDTMSDSTPDMTPDSAMPDDATSHDIMPGSKPDARPKSPRVPPGPRPPRFRQSFGSPASLLHGFIWPRRRPPDTLLRGFLWPRRRLPDTSLRGLT
ncbi:hypothetical protein CRENBAI_009364 [Crenichthys baileyi]|uniref:Uncharacterized protein n=1 Tax=Crenichthys baileyi TaxID=28760 RepID=A0AAV9R733_9TELE